MERVRHAVSPAPSSAFLAHALLACLLVPANAADPPAQRPGTGIAKIADTVVDPSALILARSARYGRSINGVAFQQEVLTSLAGRQYLGYYDASRRVCLARRSLPDGAWSSIRFADYEFKSDDAHNTISIGICPSDGTIHLAFDHHVGPLHYRVSRPGIATGPADLAWDASLFGPIASLLGTGRINAVTYPRFWPTPAGGLQFCYRTGGSGNGVNMMADYDPATATWSGLRAVDSKEGCYTGASGSSDSRCSYPNGYDYAADGTLHVTWTWRELGSNHDIMYAFSRDGGRTWRNQLNEALDGPPRIDSPGVTAVTVPGALGLMNNQAQAVDSKGRIHVVMWHATEESLAAVPGAPRKTPWGPVDARRYHHYFRTEDGRWEHRTLPWTAGTRPTLVLDRDDNAYLVYAADDQKHPAEDENIYPQRSDLFIARAGAGSAWTDWRVIHREPGPFVNEMLADRARWKREGVLSVMVQASAGSEWSSSLRVLDFRCP